MGLVERLWRRPQQVWLRRAMFQIHLWTGIGFGLYIFIVCVTGSALVYRNEMYKTLWPGPPAVQVLEKRLTHEEIAAAATKLYPGWSISHIWDNKDPGVAIEVWMEKDDAKNNRLFDPFTGRDLGRAVPLSIQAIAWTSDLHTNLLLGKKGRIVNGAGGFLLVLVCISGAVVWWPGVRNWRRSLWIDWKANWKRLNWDLHSAVGFWMFSVVFIFGITGAYLVFTMPFQRVIDRFAPLDFYRLPDDASLRAPAAPVLVTVADTSELAQLNQAKGKRRRPPPHYSFGDWIVRWSSWLHFGNFGGSFIKGVWVVLGLVPPFLLVTGAIMWWNRVLSREARKLRKRAEAIPAAAAS